MKFFFPIISLTIAGVLFFLVTDKMLVNAPLNETVRDAATGQLDITKSSGGIRALRARAEQLSAAIAKADELGKVINGLNEKYNSFVPADLVKLDQLLPDYVDNIQLIIDVNGIARKNGMSIKNIKVATDADQKTVAGTRPQASFDPRLGTMTLSFSVTGTYAAYKAFVADVASSLRLIDISSTSFNTDDKGVYTYNVELRTYWFK